VLQGGYSTDQDKSFALAYMAKHAHLPDVVICGNDTDVLVILLYHLGTGNIKANMWMDASADGNNTRHYVNVSGLSKELCPDICSALPETLLHRV